MTAAEMKSLFLTLYDAATSLAAPGWEDSEISDFLNKASLDLINELYNKRDFKHLSNLITTEGISMNSHTSYPNALSYAFDLADIDNYVFLYYISSETELSRTYPSVTSQFVPNEEVDLLNVKNFIQTDMNKVWFKYPKCYFEYDDSQLNPIFTVIYDSYTTPTGWANLRFLAKPTDINITTTTDTNINPVLHKEIVDKAVELAVKSIKIAKITNQG